MKSLSKCVSAPSLLELAMWSCKRDSDVRKGICSLEKCFEEWQEEYQLVDDNDCEFFDQLASDALNLALSGDNESRANFVEYLQEYIWNQRYIYEMTMDSDGISSLWEVDRHVYADKRCQMAKLIYKYYLHHLELSKDCARIAEEGQD